MPSLAILVSTVLVLTCGQDTHTQIITDADDRYTYATTDGACNNTGVHISIAPWVVTSVNVDHNLNSAIGSQYLKILHTKMLLHPFGFA